MHHVLVRCGKLVHILAKCLVGMGEAAGRRPREHLIAERSRLHRCTVSENRRAYCSNPGRDADSVTTLVLLARLFGCAGCSNPGRDAGSVTTRHCSHVSKSDSRRAFASKTGNTPHRRGFPFSEREYTGNASDAQGRLESKKKFVLFCEHLCLAVPELRYSQLSPDTLTNSTTISLKCYNSECVEPYESQLL